MSSTAHAFCLSLCTTLTRRCTRAMPYRAIFTFAVQARHIFKLPDVARLASGSCRSPGQNQTESRPAGECTVYVVSRACNFWTHQSMHNRGHTDTLCAHATSITSATLRGAADGDRTYRGSLSTTGLVLPLRRTHRMRCMLLQRKLLARGTIPLSAGRLQY